MISTIASDVCSIYLFFYIREIQHLKIVFWSLITIQECIIQITNYLYHTITTNKPLKFKIIKNLCLSLR